MARVITHALLILLLTGCDQAYNENAEKEEFSRLEKLYTDGKFDSCLIQTEIFLAKYPKNDLAWSLFGGTYMTFRKDSLDSLAGIYVEKALELNPDNYVALVNKAILLDKRKEYDKARGFYNQVLEIKPDYPQLYSNYVGNRLKVEDYKLAVKYGEIAVGLANQLQDKSVLCISYHFNKEYSKRDSLFGILETHDYIHLDELKHIFEAR